MPFACSTAHVSGTTSGINMPSVPQLVPVVNAVIADNTKTIAGTSGGDSVSASIDTRYLAVWRSTVTADNDQARTSTIMANIIAFTPPNQASTVSCPDSIPCMVVITAAVTAPSSDAHIMAL